MASCLSSVLQYIQVTVVEVAEEQITQLPPITRSRAASLAGTAAAAAAAAGSASMSTGSRFGFIRDHARRRSKAGSNAAAAAAVAAPVWASIDGGDSHTAPLLEYEMQNEVGAMRLSVVLLQKASRSAHRVWPCVAWVQSERSCSSTVQCM
jgi:hypothetical protein